MAILFYILGIFCGFLFTNVPVNAAGYYGTRLGPLSQLHHGVSGEVFAVDSRTLFIKNFNYDGEGPAAYFYVGNSARPSNQGGIRIRDELGGTGVLKRYRHKDITLSLPDGKSLKDIRWFSVWCDEFSVNFGDVSIPKNLQFPRPQKIAPLNGVHEVSSDNIVIVDAQTLLIPNFSYDGEAPDAKFWVGRGPKPSPNGLRIPDENGKETPLRRYERKTIVLTLPGDLTIFDIGHFGVWCEAFTVDFGHIQIPEGIVVPPSLRMLGISPQSKLNCEVLYDDLAFEVRWAIAGESVVIQLVAKLDDNEYMSFGLSPNKTYTEMVGADVAVAWVDKQTGKGHSYDYYLDDRSQCSGKHGSCPDSNLESNTNSVRLLNAAMVNGYSIVTYQRPIRAQDKYDLSILTSEPQAIAWAIGPLNQRNEVSYHSQFTHGDQFIDFGRPPVWNCPMPEGENKLENDNSFQSNRRPSKEQPEPPRRGTSNRGPLAGGDRNNHHEEEHEEPNHDHNRDHSHRNSNRRNPPPSPANPPPRKETVLDRPRRPVPTPRPAAKAGAWEIPPIQCHEPEDGVFYAQMGPTGGKQGYPAITGHVGWGISWYINGLLIPEINVVRGKTYTFVVEGGHDPDVPAKYHPFYITDDEVGGYEHKSDEEKSNIRIFAGVQRTRNGGIIPTGVGRLCNWTPDIDGPQADEYPSFGAYQRTLTLKCDEGEPGIITWTPDDNTPDTVFYQCFTHRYLGWRINVLDECDYAQSSNIDEVVVSPDEDEVSAAPSIIHETRLKPTDNFLLLHEKDLIKNHNMNGKPPKVLLNFQKNAEISKLIENGIRAAEELEESIRPHSPANIKSHTLNKTNLDPSFYNDEEVPVAVPVYVLQPKNTTYRNTTVFPEQKIHESPQQGLPVFLRPPKIPPRRQPPPVERRPPPPPQARRPLRPYQVPQPSIIVNHYKKPGVSPGRSPYGKPSGPGGLNNPSNGHVLHLGQPTEIRSQLPPNFANKPPAPAPHLKNPAQIPYRDFPSKPHRKPEPKFPPKRKKPIAQESQYQRPIEKTRFQPPTETIAQESKISPAVNTGFQPGSVIVEGGFKPIVRRRDENIEDDEEIDSFQRRRDDNISEIDEALDGDAAFIGQEEDDKSFEPMFIPSPPDSSNVPGGRSRKKEKLSGDLIDMDVENGEDKIAMAGERIDAYYLPPDHTKPIANQAIPEGAVVTYDGKAVLDTTLLNLPPPPLLSTKSKNPHSRLEQLVRSPQFGPFHGEIPPSPPEYVAHQSAVQLSSQPYNPPSVSLETSIKQTNSHNTNPISTKLTLLKAN